MFTQSQIDNLTIEEKIRYGIFPIDDDTEERLHAGELAINALDNVGVWPLYSDADIVEKELAEVLAVSGNEQRERMKQILDCIASKVKDAQQICTDTKRVAAKLENLQKDIAGWIDNLS